MDKIMPETDRVEHPTWCQSHIAGDSTHRGEQLRLEGEHALVSVQAMADTSSSVLQVWAWDSQLHGGPSLVRLSRDDARSLAGMLLRAVAEPTPDDRGFAPGSDAVRTLLGTQPAYDERAGVAR